MVLATISKKIPKPNRTILQKTLNLYMNRRSKCDDSCKKCNNSVTNTAPSANTTMTIITILITMVNISSKISQALTKPLQTSSWANSLSNNWWRSTARTPSNTRRCTTSRSSKTWRNWLISRKTRGNTWSIWKMLRWRSRRRKRSWRKISWTMRSSWRNPKKEPQSIA